METSRLNQQDRTNSNTPRSKTNTLRLCAANVLVGGVYWALAILVFRYFSRYKMWPAPIWFPAGVSMFAALSIGPWSWPGIFAGSLLTNTITFGEPLLWSTVISLGNTIAAILSVVLIRGKIRSDHPLGRIVQVCRISIACILNGIISATIGATAVWARDRGPVQAWLYRWFEWTASDAGAALLLVPLLLLVQYKTVSLKLIRKHAVEFGITVSASLATVTYFMSRSRALPAADAGASFLILLPLLWISVRFSVRIAYPMFALLIITLMVGTLAGYGPYAGVDGGGTFIVFAQMVIGFGIAVLLLGAASEEQNDAEKALRKLNRNLEQIVEGRTAELRESKAQLERAAFHDPLTALPNRRLLEKYFAGCRAAALRSGSHFAFLLIDLDFFKEVNDEFGHDAGDAVLVETAKRLSAVVRQYDFVARMGGDEFAVVFSELGHALSIESICIRIVKELSEPFSYGGTQVRITPSVGIAVYPNDGDSWTPIYKAADKALYSAKRNGRARWVQHLPTEPVISADVR